MIKAEFVEDAYDYAADLVAATAGIGNRLDKHVQRLFVVTGVGAPSAKRLTRPVRPVHYNSLKIVGLLD